MKFKPAVTMAAAVVALAVSTTLTVSGPRMAAQPNTSGAKTGTGQGSLQEQVVAQERKELDAIKIGNMDLFASLIAEEAVFVDARGTAGKAEVVRNTAHFKLLEYTMEDVKFVPISANSGVIAYKLVQKVASHGQELTSQAYASAIWIERGGKWVCVFSQETAAK
jgi:hypothetical protein